jgi:transcriptional regulator with XRE-family HTH domain
MANRTFLVGTGLRLKKIREYLNYSRQDMANFMKVKLPTYYKNENSETFPRLESLILLFEKHDISMDWFMFGKGPMLFQKERNRVRDLEQKLETLHEKVERKATPEVKELVEHMDRIPLLRHEVLGFFHRFKMDNRELVEAPTAQPRD